LRTAQGGLADAPGSHAHDLDRDGGRGHHRAAAGRLRHDHPVAGQAVPCPMTESTGPMEAQGVKRWYVVHAYSGFEKSVAQALRDRIARAEMQDRFGDVLVPTVEVVEMRSGQKRRSERKFFPGYVLVQIATHDDNGIPRIDSEC